LGRTTRLDLSVNGPAVAQLPVWFYPRLLEVRDNGRALDPSAYGHIDRLLAVKLSPGEHRLAVRFVGLRWANWVSGIAWLTVIGVAVASVVHKVRRRKAARVANRFAAAPVFPLRAAVFGFLLMAAPMILPAAHAHRRKNAAERSAGVVLPSSEAFPGARALYAFDGDPDTEWVTPPGESAWLVVLPPAPRRVSAIELEPRQMDVLGGWHRVTVALYLGDKTVAEQTFEMPDAARQPVQVLTLDRPQLADGIELRFSRPVTLRRDGKTYVPPEACYAGYREIRIR
jgi:hypothetical protein